MAGFVSRNESSDRLLDRNVYILCVHIDNSLYTPDYVQRAKSWVSKESSGTQPQKCTNESRQEPWLVATYLGKRLPVISSVKVVIKDSSMPVSGMAGTAGLTEGCRWNNAAVGYAGHPDGPGRSHVCRQGCRPGAPVRTGHPRLPAGLPVGGLYPHDGEYLPLNALLGLRYGLVHHRLPANRRVQGPLRNRYPRHPAPRGQGPPGPLCAGASCSFKSWKEPRFKGHIRRSHKLTETLLKLMQKSCNAHGNLTTV